MSKYILKIDASFEKGDCYKCPLSYRACAGCESDGSELYCVLYGMGNCPLEEVEQGEWVGTVLPRCSNCGSGISLDGDEYYWRDKIRFNYSDFCPNCGAEMKGGK